MLYRFIDNEGAFSVKDPGRFDAYFPLTDKEGRLLSAIAPNLAGDIKKDNDHFITPPVSVLDLKNNLLCRRRFFVKVKDAVVEAGQSPDTVGGGFLYHTTAKNTAGLALETLAFVPSDTPVEVMRTTITNKSRKPLTITSTAFIPLYGRAERNLRDHRHVSSLLNRLELADGLIVLKPTMVFDEKGHTENKVRYFSFAFAAGGRMPAGQFPTLEYFCGEGDLSRPDAVYKNVRPVKKHAPSFDGQEACAAWRFAAITLKPGTAIAYFTVTGAETTAAKIDEYREMLGTPVAIEDALNATRRYWQNYLANLQFDFKDKNINGWLKWVSLQPTLRKLFGCSFLPHFDYGKGGRGWRDLWQDALTLLLTEPDKAKALITNSFRGVRIDGTNATIITRDSGFIADRNKISRVWMDHGVWPYLTLRLYLNRTGDGDLLFTETPYFRDHQLKRAREVDKNFSGENILKDTGGKIYQGTILEHVLVQSLCAYFNAGAHNAVRLENADWNDGLDMAGDKGESVAFSFMYAHNLKGLADLLSNMGDKEISLLAELDLLLNPAVNYNDHRAKQEALQRYLESVKNISGKKIVITARALADNLNEKARRLFDWLNGHEWLAEGFMNGYYDNQSRRVDGAYDGRLHMTLPSQVFPILSEALNPSAVEKIYAAALKHLYDKKTGGFRLNTDFGAIRMDLGRAFGFAYGEKENGAVFSHMAVMFAHALYKNGFSAEGSFVLNSLYRMATRPQAKIYPMLPEYFNSRGQGLYHYLTGSASWYIYTLLEEVLGVKYLLGDLLLEPKLSAADFKKDRLGVAYLFNGKRVRVQFFKGSSSGQYRLAKVSLNANPVPCDEHKCLISKSTLAAVNEINLNVVLK